MQGAYCAEACLSADAPSTTLLRSAVPLPRCAGQDERREQRSNVARIERSEIRVSRSAPEACAGLAESPPHRPRNSFDYAPGRDANPDFSSLNPGYVLRSAVALPRFAGQDESASRNDAVIEGRSLYRRPSLDKVSPFMLRAVT